jgi:hypothetical protein
MDLGHFETAGGIEPTKIAGRGWGAADDAVRRGATRGYSTASRNLRGRDGSSTTCHRYVTAMGGQLWFTPGALSDVRFTPERYQMSGAR